MGIVPGCALVCYRAFIGSSIAASASTCLARPIRFSAIGTCPTMLEVSTTFASATGKFQDAPICASPHALALSIAPFLHWRTLIDTATAILDRFFKCLGCLVKLIEINIG